jgi:hypothetical protein
LKKANGARVVNVSSGGHQFSDFNFEDPNFLHRDYETLLGYGQSKTAVNLFSMELTIIKRIQCQKLCFMSGAVGETELGREAPLDLISKIRLCGFGRNLLPEVKASLKTIPQGAATTVWCATSPLLNDLGGIYCENVDVAELNSDVKIIGGIKPYSLDETNAKKIMEIERRK